MAWTITFYDARVEDETLALPSGIVANPIHILELIGEFGPSLGRPHTAPLGKGLFEIRAKCKEGIARALFCMPKGREIVILHTFMKKTRRIPKNDRDVARRRMKEVLDDG